ncbi:hypothetical protein MtrunA17_Chr2g0279971 [Medicago truncatula]|uniref:DUF7026 domain-containing protein n=1 Tax=Medicago truncatula TaxID=3880 RepID=A2Q1B5_MEDTR|nr:uncharacterized protein LOC11430358 [Medicago truncatula]ABN05732.1 hypothetical protein MtrDRAFT_AC148396g23v2 [Medicago truncatula]AES63573.1 hypothetical protein MTR_2g010200 [Medicago truncatula]RHN71728.1 hypothetical protein MtrunA17_Chr2g0279971 [Medicago truncatula]
MALRIQHVPIFFTISPITLSTNPKAKPPRISCTNNNNDVSLASEFAEKASIINARAKQAEEAMRKSRNIVFKELCEYLELNEEDAKLKWKKMGEDEKWVLVNGFVTELGQFFHPLSEKATKELLEEYLLQENQPPKASQISYPLFPFDSIIGFP